MFAQRMKVNMRAILFIVLILPVAGYGQLIKPKAKMTPTKLDSIFISDKFSYDDLDTVYEVFSKKYGIEIIYDKNYCRRRYFTYWFMNTSLSKAIEITTREQGLTYEIIDSKHVKITRIPGFVSNDITGNEMTDEKILETTAGATKYSGPAEKTDFTLSGRVVDIFTGEPLSFSLVKLKNGQNGTTSNTDGFFTLLKVPADTVTLIVSYMSYKTREVHLSPQVNKNNFIIELLPVQSALDEVVITANREDMMEMSSDNLSMMKISPKKLSELPNVGEKDVMRAFQLMPGVSAANESSAGLYVRGGTPDQNLVTYDGFTIYHVDHLYGFYSAFNANALKDVQLYKGGFGAKYGGRLSSVMEITGKEGNKKQFNFGGDISLLSGNLFMEVPVTEKLTALAAWRRSWKGPIYNWIFDSFNQGDEEEEQAPGPGMPGGGNTQTTNYFSDLNTKVTYNASPKDNIAFSYFYSIDKLDNSVSINSGGMGGPAGAGGGGNNFSNGVTDLTKYGNIGMSLKWSRKWSNKIYGNTIFSYSNYYSDRDRSNERTITDDDGVETTTKTGIFENNNLKDISLKSDYEWSLFKNNKLNFGIFGTSYDIQYTYSQNDTSDLLAKSNIGVIAGGYLENKYSFLNNKADITAGLRYTYFDVTAKPYYEPRAAIGYKFTEELTLRASYGKYYQFANRITREDILSGSRDFWILSDGSSIPVSSSTHYIAGLSYEGKNYLFNIEAYYKKLYDITEYSLRFSSSFRNVTYTENFYTGTGYAKGLEFLVQKKSGKFSGWVSYTLGEAKNQFLVYTSDYYPANQNVTHEFKAVGVYKYKRWDFAATWIYATGKPYTAPGGSYSIELLDGTTQDYFTVTSKNSLRLPDYHRLDLSANYHIYNSTMKDIGYIGLSVFNMYNRTNVWYKQFYIEGNQMVESDVNYLGITPNLTLSLRIR